MDQTFRVWNDKVEYFFKYEKFSLRNISGNHGTNRFITGWDIGTRRKGGVILVKDIGGLMNLIQLSTRNRLKLSILTDICIGI